MSYRWVVDPEHPQGHLVEMTAEEEAQHALDEAEGAADAALETAENAVEATLRTRAGGARANLVAGANAIKNGTLFADRTVNERGYLELLGRGEAALIRLELQQLEAAD